MVDAMGVLWDNNLLFLLSSHSELRMSREHSTIKILVIDDSKTIRRAAETILTKDGFQVLTAIDGFDALPKVIDFAPDIVFVDVMMPRLDGYQACTLIKNNSKFAQTPVVMLSSKDGLFDKARGRIVGADVYMTKPFTRDEIVAVIERLVPGCANYVAPEEKKFDLGGHEEASPDLSLDDSAYSTL
jgi:twitching motility two-component system response regulator PilG